MGTYTGPNAYVQKLGGRISISEISTLFPQIHSSISATVFSIKAIFATQGLININPLDAGFSQQFRLSDATPRPSST